jgi:hypothetical protein
MFIKMLDEFFKKTTPKLIQNALKKNNLLFKMTPVVCLHLFEHAKFFEMLQILSQVLSIHIK